MIGSKAGAMFTVPIAGTMTGAMTWAGRAEAFAAAVGVNDHVHMDDAVGEMTLHGHGLAFGGGRFVTARTGIDQGAAAFVLNDKFAAEGFGNFALYRDGRKIRQLGDWLGL